MSNISWMNIYFNYFPNQAIVFPQLNTVLLTELLALELGCYPTFWKILLKDPVLAFRIWYGPMFASQYRLLGPDSRWEKAAKVCHAFYEEEHSSLRHREVSKLLRPDLCGCTKTRLIIFSSVAAIIGFVAYIKHMLPKIILPQPLTQLLSFQ